MKEGLVMESAALGIAPHPDVPEFVETAGGRFELVEGPTTQQLSTEMGEPASPTEARTSITLEEFIEEIGKSAVANALAAGPRRRKSKFNSLV